MFDIYTVVPDDEIRKSRGLERIYISVGADWEKVLNGLHPPSPPLLLLFSFIEMGFNFPLYICRVIGNIFRSDHETRGCRGRPG
jgi:hypothetical protein